MLEGAVILMLVALAALYVVLTLGIGAIQAILVVRAKRRHVAAAADSQPTAWRRSSPTILTWLVPQILALCLSACLVPALLAIWVSEFRAGGFTISEFSLPHLLLTGGVYLALAITLTIECVLAWLIRRPFIVHLVVVPWPLFLLPVLALLLLLGNL